MDNLDAKTMIFLGTQVVLTGGLGFWMKKRIDAADERIEELEKKMLAYEEIITQQQNLLSKHDAGLRQLFGMPPPTPGTPNPGTPNPGTPNPQSSEVKPAKSKDVPKKEDNPKEEKVEEIEDDISPEQLDEILKSELQNNQSLEIDTVLPEEERKPLKKKSTKKKIV